MSYSRLKQDDRLVTARLTINVVKNDDELRSLMLNYGIDDAHLNEGLALQERAQEITSKRVMEFGSGISSTQLLRASVKKARSTYGTLRRVIRLALETDDRGLLTQLRMHQPIAQKLETFIAQAEHFYTEALAIPDLLTIVARFNITTDVLQAGLDEINQVTEIRAQQMQQRGLAQVVTQQRISAMADLDQWMKEFLGLLRIATLRDPQQMEKLGAIVKSENRSAPPPPVDGGAGGELRAVEQ